MRSKEEIINNVRLSGIRDDGVMLFGTITIPNFQGSFVCGFDEGGFEHVSVSSYKKRQMPTWDDMCRVKDIFWKDDEECYQIHPKKSEYVNVNDNCLHIWRNKKFELSGERLAELRGKNET